MDRLIKAAADEGSLEPSFLNATPVGNDRAQCPMIMDLRLHPSNEPETIEVADPRQQQRGSESVVRPIPGLFEPGSSTPALADADFDVIVR